MLQLSVNFTLTSSITGREITYVTFAVERPFSIDTVRVIRARVSFALINVFLTSNSAPSFGTVTRSDDNVT
jgi:hypothetical protein